MQPRPLLFLSNDDIPPRSCIGSVDEPVCFSCPAKLDWMVHLFGGPLDKNIALCILIFGSRRCHPLLLDIFFVTFMFFFFLFLLSHLVCMFSFRNTPIFFIICCATSFLMSFFLFVYFFITAFQSFFASIFASLSILTTGIYRRIARRGEYIFIHPCARLCFENPTRRHDGNGKQARNGEG